MSERMAALLAKPRRTFWFLLPTKELADQIHNNPEVKAELEKINECVNFQWDPAKVVIKDMDLGFVVIPDLETVDWHKFAWNVGWLNPQIFMTNERDLRKHLPPHADDGFHRICQVINTQRTRYPLNLKQPKENMEAILTITEGCRRCESSGGEVYYVEAVLTSASEQHDYTKEEVVGMSGQMHYCDLEGIRNAIVEHHVKQGYQILYGVVSSKELDRSVHDYRLKCPS